MIVVRFATASARAALAYRKVAPTFIASTVGAKDRRLMITIRLAVLGGLRTVPPVSP